MSERYVAEYLRLSMEDGDMIDGKESNSITYQRSLISGYRSEKGIYPDREVLEFVDDGYSGTNFERPGVKRLLSLVKEGKVCCIMVKDISRFGRNFLEVSDYLEQIFPFLEVRFIAVNDGYDSDDYIGTTGGIEIALRNLLYDMYSKDLSVKMCSALAVRRKRGDYIGPRPPFGYRFGSDRRKLEIDPVAAGYVKRVFELALQGHSTGQIAIELNREGIPTPGQYKNYEKEKKQYHITGATGHWSSRNVLKILENRVYLGVVVNAKYKVTKIGGHQFKRVPDEERIYVTGRHEAIVTEKEFNGASAVIKYRGEQKGKEHHFNKEKNTTEADGREADSDREKKKVLKKKQEFLKAKKQGLYESYKLGGMSRNDYLNKVSELREKEEKLRERVSEIEAMNKRREKTEKMCMKVYGGIDCKKIRNVGFC